MGRGSLMAAASQRKPLARPCLRHYAILDTPARRFYPQSPNGFPDSGCIGTPGGLPQPPFGFLSTTMEVSTMTRLYRSLPSIALACALSAPTLVNVPLTFAQQQPAQP